MKDLTQILSAEDLLTFGPIFMLRRRVAYGHHAAIKGLKAVDAKQAEAAMKCRNRSLINAQIPR